MKNGDDEKGGSQAYVPPNEKDDKQLSAAEDILRGVNQASQTPPKPAAPDVKTDQPEKVPN